MKVLVTGDTGYIGTIMVPMLMAEGFDVIGLDADLFDNCIFGEAPAQTPHLRCDIRDLTVDNLRGFDAICHMAALSNDPLGDLNPNLTYEINHHASVRLATLAKQAGVGRFIMSSSCSLYGVAGGSSADEESPLSPITPYARSKAMVEWSIAALADDTFSPVSLRNATAFGVSPRMRFDLVVNNLVAWAAASGKVLIKSDGTPWRPLVHIEDIVGAFIAALRAPREAVHNEAFNIGQDTENYQIRDIADMVQKTIPGCVITYLAGGEPDKRSYRVNFGKAAARLPGFNPRWTVEQGVRQLYAAYQQVGISVEDFEGPRFRRIDALKRLLAEGQVDASMRRREFTEDPTSRASPSLSLVAS
jgi:nucleoside-diphosphate-sugar epimerase